MTNEYVNMYKERCRWWDAL